MKLMPTEKKKTLYSAADVRVGKDSFTATLDVNNKEVTFPLTVLPAAVDLVSGRYKLALSNDMKTLFGFGPLSGSFVMKFSRFWKQPTATLPSPKHDVGTKMGQDGPYSVDEYTFSAICEVTQGPCTGMETSFSFLYFRPYEDGEGGSGFVPDEDGNVSLKGVTAKATRLQRLLAFLEATGAWGRPIVYSENILPVLERAIQEENREFLVVMRNGFPDSFSSLVETATPKKKPAAKKTAAKKKK